MATPQTKTPTTLEEALARLKRDPIHPVRAHVDDLDVELRVVPSRRREGPGLGTRMAALGGPWQGESTHALRATVKDGHLMLDEPVDLPDGTVVDLMPVDDGDDLDDDDRARLHAALNRSQKDFLAGKGIPAEEVLAELSARSGR